MARSDCLPGCGCVDCCCCACCCKHCEIIFKCGSPKTESHPSGCDCGGGTPFFDDQFKIPEFEPIRILSGGKCSIPCSDVTVSMSASCCLLCAGAGVTAKGPGTISGGVSGSGMCAPFILTLNGGSGPVVVNDGDSVSVSVSSGNADCDCCCVFSQCKIGTYPNCDTLSMFRKYIYKNGKIILNQSYLNSKLNLARQVKQGIRPTNRPVKPKTRPTKRKLMF